MSKLPKPDSPLLLRRSVTFDRNQKKASSDSQLQIQHALLKE